MFLKNFLSVCSKRVAPGVGAIALAFAALLTGCETTSAGGEGSAARSSGKAAIEKGMDKSEVIAAIGEPDSIEEIAEADAVAEVWTYKEERVVSSTIESDGEQERVYIDRSTGLMETVREPIYRNEQVKAIVTTQLLFHGDELIAFKETVEDGIYKVGHK